MLTDEQRKSAETWRETLRADGKTGLSIAAMRLEDNKSVLPAIRYSIVEYRRQKFAWIIPGTPTDIDGTFNRDIIFCSSGNNYFVASHTQDESGEPFFVLWPLGRLPRPNEVTRPIFFYPA